MLTEFERMRLIGDEFPLPLVDPAVIAKMDAVVLAVERAVRSAMRGDVERLHEALRSIDFAAGHAIGKSATEMEDDLMKIARAARLALGPNVKWAAR